MNDKFSHLDDSGQVHMVDVTHKPGSLRIAAARGKIMMRPETLASITGGLIPKGNVLTAAKLAGIGAAKRTADLIPLCHPLQLTWIDIQFETSATDITITATVKAKDSTGVEMEALTAVSVAALTIYDMCKAVDKSMIISGIELIQKHGGKSSHTTDFRPRTGVVVVSDSTAAGKRRDESGKILVDGFSAAGCEMATLTVVNDDSSAIAEAIGNLLAAGTQLIITAGGTGLGPRDNTIKVVAGLIDSRLSGVEQALHHYGRSKLPTAMLSNLLVGRKGDAIIVSLPGSRGAAKDALAVLIPSLFHAYDIMEGGGHMDTKG